VLDDVAGVSYLLKPHLPQRVGGDVDDVVELGRGLGPGRKCSKYQMMEFNSRIDGLNYVEGHFEHFLPSPTAGAGGAGRGAGVGFLLASAAAAAAAAAFLPGSVVRASLVLVHPFRISSTNSRGPFRTPAVGPV